MPAAPDEPAAVSRVFAGFPPAAQRKLRQVRALIYNSAAANSDIGELTETLKWGQPSYLPKKPGVGTTVRLGWSDKQPGQVSLFVHCQTTLVDTYRTLMGDELSFEGNRAVIIPLKGALPKTALSLCVDAALTYHLKKRSTRQGTFDQFSTAQ